MAKRKYVVRVVLMPDQREGCDGILECLRYAQVITVHRNDPAGMCFDIDCPPGLESDRWAKANADRMATFGYNAVVAPSTRTDGK